MGRGIHPHKSADPTESKGAQPSQIDGVLIEPRV
jgi:hypothetical protein